MSRIRGLSAQEFAEEVSKELESDLYTKYILEEAISGRVFLAQGPEGDALVEDFKDLDSGSEIKRGHKLLLKDLRKSWLLSEASNGGTGTARTAGDTLTRDGGGQAVNLQKGIQGSTGMRESMSENLTQQVDVSERGNNTQSRSQSRAAPSSPVTASKLFKTLWHSKKYTAVVGKHGVRRLQSFHARVVSRVAADLGLSDYMPNETKAKETPSEEELTRLRSINLKKNPKDQEWRDKIFDSILEDDEHAGEIVGLDGTVYKWPKACYNSTFTAIIDDLKKKLVHADRYKKSQADKLKRYHDRKQLKKRAQAGKDGAPEMQEKPHHCNENESSKDQSCGNPDPESQEAMNLPPSHADKNEPLEPKPKTSCSLDTCSSTERPSGYCQTCLEPVHKECMQTLLTKLYGVANYDGDLLYCANHHSNFGFRQGLGGKCTLPACAMAGKPTQHRCDVCKEPVHNLCFQGFLREVYNVECYDGGRFACQEHAGALGFEKASGQHRSSPQNKTSADLCAEALINQAAQQAARPAAVLSGSALSPPRGVSAAGKGSEERVKAGEGERLEEREEKGKLDETKKGSAKRKGSQGDREKNKKKRAAGVSPVNEEPNEQDESGGPSQKNKEPPTDQPVEETQAVRQSNRAPKMNRMIHNDSYVVNSKPAAAGTDTRQKTREQSKAGAKKKRKSDEDSEESLSLSGSAIESSEEEDSDAEATSDLPIGGAFEDKDEKLHPLMVDNYQIIAMTALEVNASYQLTSRALQKAINRLKLPGISKSPDLTGFNQNYLLKLLGEGLIKKKKVVIKNRKWREEGTVLDPADVRVRF
ncbi:hypothetical protein KFL_004010030 [Klebsormidium nitens]|uniref:Uncharacterized protein n=1 Tax=Klebsormidium nitens TaxID=105231 RepID=A0A1Y1IGC8_KLENI|nr:hypothetical protein KFL_004010030 [Klebsormidium nitens]|eukprot:GAQ88111.1 hypothetical protein KFL_004010030 [Klebsormidium nitens]